jgi:tetratricopeptide (TPR) repeat protein
MSQSHRATEPVGAVKPARSKPVSSSSPLFRWLKLALVVILAAVLLDAAVILFRGKPQPTTSILLPNIAQLPELRTLARENPRSADLHLALAHVFLDNKHYLSAQEEFSTALNAGAEEWGTRKGRAQANIALERNDLAETDILRLIELRPHRLETYLSLAEVRQDSDLWKEAEKALDSVPRDGNGLPDVEGYKDRLESAELLATAYNHLDRWDRALALANLCLKQEPQRLSTHILMGKTLHGAGRMAEAIPYLIEGVKASPNNAEMLYLLGSAYQKRHAPGDADKAAVCFQKTVTLDSKHGAATLEVAHEAERRKAWGPAAFAYQRAHKLGMEGPHLILRSAEMILKTGNREEGWYRRGLYYEATARPDLALVEYTRLTTLHDSCRSGYIHMSHAYMGMHRYDKALEYLRKAQQAAPATAKQLDWLILDAMGELKQENERIKLLTNIIQEGGDDGNEAAYQLAKIQDRAGIRPEAEKWYRFCTQAAPKDAVFHRELGIFLLQERQDPSRLQAAVHELETAAQLDPEDHDAIYHLGLAYSYSGNHEEALLAIRHAIDLQPEVGEGYQTLASVLTDAGRRSEAAAVQEIFKRYARFSETRETLQARCKREPRNPQVHLKMAEFHMYAHEYQAAIARFRLCLALQPGNRQARARLAEACGNMGRRDEQRLELAILANHKADNP